jgi:hypothetical protein
MMQVDVDLRIAPGDVCALGSELCTLNFTLLTLYFVTLYFQSTRFKPQPSSSDGAAPYR